MTGPLDGYRILDLTTMISGPVATRILADQGADVIKIEAPGAGDLVRHMGGGKNGLSAAFVTVNRNKRSLVLDLKTEKGRELVKELCKTADVFVQNFRPGAIDRMGLGVDVLHAINPSLIYVSISGFGKSGPYANKRVYDPVIQALSGLAYVQRDRDSGRPRMVRTIVPDKLTAVTVAQATTAALLKRERHGNGDHVEVAMLDAMIAFLWPEGLAGQTFAGDRKAGSERSSLAKDLIYQTLDGYITAGAVSDVEWQGMVRALEQPQWLDDERFSTPAGRVRFAEARLLQTESVLKTNTSAYWLARLDAEDVPCAPVLDEWDLADHPQVIENQIIHQSQHPLAGSMRQARPPENFASANQMTLNPAPALGENSREILQELGLDDEQIDILFSDKVCA